MLIIIFIINYKRLSGIILFVRKAIERRLLRLGVDVWCGLSEIRLWIGESFGVLVARAEAANKICFDFFVRYSWFVAECNIPCLDFDEMYGQTFSWCDRVVNCELIEIFNGGIWWKPVDSIICIVCPKSPCVWVFFEYLENEMR